MDKGSGADVVVQRELKYEVRNSPELWAACIAGALPETDSASWRSHPG